MKIIKVGERWYWVDPDFTTSPFKAKCFKFEFMAKITQKRL